MDTLKGAALIGTLIGVLITFAMWVSLWENVWQASVEPTRGAIYELNSIGLGLHLAFAHLGCGGGWWTSRRSRDVRSSTKVPALGHTS